MPTDHIAAAAGRPADVFPEPIRSSESEELISMANSIKSIVYRVKSAGIDALAQVRQKRHPLPHLEGDVTPYVLVAGVDGVLTCLDSETGQKLWSWQDPDKIPMVRNYCSKVVDDPVPNPNPLEDPMYRNKFEMAEDTPCFKPDEEEDEEDVAFAVEPHGDGRIYQVRRENGQLQAARMPATIRELTACPSVSKQDVKFITSKHDKIYEIDLETGHTIKVFDEHRAHFNPAYRDTENIPTLRFSRTEYSTSVYKSDISRPNWTVKFTDYNPSIPRFRHTQIRRAMGRRVIDEIGGELTIQPGRRVVFRKPDGQVKWSRQLDAPPVEILHVVSAPEHEPEHIHHVINRPPPAKSHKQEGKVNIDIWDGSLYAMSQDHYPDFVDSPQLLIGNGERTYASALPSEVATQEGYTSEDFDMGSGQPPTLADVEEANRYLADYPAGFVGTYSFRDILIPPIDRQAIDGSHYLQQDSTSHSVAFLFGVLFMITVTLFLRSSGVQAWCFAKLGWVLAVAGIHKHMGVSFGRNKRRSKKQSSKAKKDEKYQKKEPQGLKSITVSEQVLGYGSQGTIVYKGTFGTRNIAVKRFLSEFFDVAHQEVKLLQESDTHPNVIRYFMQESCDKFLYIGLELCDGSLADVVETPMDKFNFPFTDPRLEPKRTLMQIFAGVSHLHDLKIIHRDIKPHNILLARSYTGDNFPRVLISDFGMCRKLNVDESSFMNSYKNINGGTVGWRAPELIRCSDVLVPVKSASTDSIEKTKTSGSDPGSGDDSAADVDSSALLSSSESVLFPQGAPRAGRISRAIDVFALGCVVHYFVTNGDHPYGDRYSREMNILRGNRDLSCLDLFGQDSDLLKHLVEWMTHDDPRQRPRAKDVMTHPYFWSSSKRLSFLQDVSDRLEKEERDPPSELLVALDADAEWVHNWPKKLSKVFMDNLGKYRKYRPDSLQDLLRAIRNKKNHYQELPPQLKRILGPVPDGYCQYFLSRFPEMVRHLYDYSVRFKSETVFGKYYGRTE